MTPTNLAEGGVPWQLTSGSYTWYALGWNAQGAGLWSTGKTFTGVYGFVSEFQPATTNWVSRSGSWGPTSGAYLTTTGAGANRWASAYYAGGQFNNATYEAKLWRNGTDSLASNIVLRGQPATLNAAGAWTNQYVFQYSRDGFYSAYKTVNGVFTTLQPWTPTASIVKGSAWNTLRVTANGTSFSFAINGTTLWSGTDASFSVGYAGVSMFSDGVAGNQLWVDYARLTAPVAATAISAEQQALNDAAQKAAPAGATADRSAGGGGSAGAQSAPAGDGSGSGGPIPSFDRPAGAPGEAPPSVTVAPPE